MTGFGLGRGGNPSTGVRISPGLPSVMDKSRRSTRSKHCSTSLSATYLSNALAKLPSTSLVVAYQSGFGLSELGIEKIIVELNGFRQRTAMLKEEISKVTRALAERAGQLNDLVAKNLRDLREQLGGSTLSGYLALQGKFSQGEIGEQEYNMQRDYFRNELQGMIRRLDESRKLMMIMAQLDSRPTGIPGTPNPTQTR